jgi:hypothetical protein
MPSAYRRLWNHQVAITGSSNHDFGSWLVQQHIKGVFKGDNPK